MRYNASSSPARFSASWLSLALAAALLGGCGGAKRWPRGESPEYTRWRGTIPPFTLPAGVPQEAVTVSVEGFVGRDNEDWVEVVVWNEIVKRFNTHSPNGKPLLLVADTRIPAGILSVKIWDTVSNQSYSLTADTKFGTLVTVKKSGSGEVTLTQGRREDDARPDVPPPDKD